MNQIPGTWHKKITQRQWRAANNRIKAPRIFLFIDNYYHDCNTIFTLNTHSQPPYGGNKILFIVYIVGEICEKNIKNDSTHIKVVIITTETKHFNTTWLNICQDRTLVSASCNVMLDYLKKFSSGLILNMFWGLCTSTTHRLFLLRLSMHCSKRKADSVPH